MSRRSTLILLALVAGLAASSSLESLPRSAAQQQGEGAVIIPNLQDTLEKGLKARLPQDFAFIEHVVEMVNDGELPVTLVTSTFQWVRTNRGNKVYLVPYFEQALKFRAAKLGISI